MTDDQYIGLMAAVILAGWCAGHHEADEYGASCKVGSAVNVAAGIALAARMASTCLPPREPPKENS